MAAEYHLATPLVPNRKTYFARYCTKHEEGVWVVVDVSLDQILQTQETMNCQKGPSGCLIQELSDGTSKVKICKAIRIMHQSYNVISLLIKQDTYML